YTFLEHPRVTTLILFFLRVFVLIPMFYSGCKDTFKKIGAIKESRKTTL
ncbi:MAG: hypothetical protein ACI9Y7_002694, partial [Dokdonia sp.]